MYKNIKINHYVLDKYENKFILFAINDNMIYCNLDHYKRMGYTYDFCDSNYKNDLDATIVYIRIEGDNINSSCIYSNIYNRWQNLTLQLLSAIGNIKATILALEITIIVIFYCNKDWFVLLND